MYHERTACDIIVSCNLEYNVKDDVKELLGKESEVILTGKDKKNTSETLCVLFLELYNLIS